ncbi:MAG: bactofilin family protein [Rubrobacteraceae bacterium]
MSLAISLSIQTSVRPLLALSSLVACMVILLPLPAHATANAIQQRAIGQVVVPSGETREEVSTTMGDVTVNGTVEDDVEVIHGNVRVNGPVGGDVKSTVGDITVRDIVEGDIEAGAGNVHVYSAVEGDIDVSSGNVYLGPEARVDGDVECVSGNVLGNRAAVQGDVIPGMASGMDRSDGDSDDSSGILGFFGWLLLTLVFAACTMLLAVLAPGTLSSVTRNLERSPGRSLLFGVVSVPVAVVLGLVLAISVVGIPVLILLAPAYLAFLFFGALVAAYFVGRKVLLATGHYRGGNALAAVVGAVVVSATSLIPFVGEILLYALALLGAGAAIVALMNRRRPRHEPYDPYETYAETWRR